MTWIISSLLDPLAYPFMQRALVTAVLVGVICAVMGSFLLVKRWSLMGDAISHAVLPGIVGALLLGIPYFVGALATGLLTALGIGAVERNTRIKSDAAMGIMFVSAFALGLVMISRIEAFVDVFHILFGNVLGVRTADLWLAAGAGVIIVLAVALFYKELLFWAFDPVMAQVNGLPTRAIHYLVMLLLSIAIVASLQAVGIVLVIAMLITPAATAFLLTRRFGAMILTATGVGVFSAVTGLYLSYYLDVASGAAMVLVSSLLFGLAVFLSPQEGLLWRKLQLRRRALQIAMEDALKVIHDHEERGGEGAVTAAHLAEGMDITQSRARRIVQRMVSRGLARSRGDGIELTDKGMSRARSLVRTHRLWERFLTDEGGRPWDAVHAEAHRLEHFTPEAVTERLAEHLGHPERDPHGAPIPAADGTITPFHDRPLTGIEPGTVVTVSRVDDENPRILRTLARIGIKPGTVVEAIACDNGRFILKVDGEELEIDGETASHIHVS